MGQTFLNNHAIVDLTLTIQGLPWATAADRDLALSNLRSGNHGAAGKWHPQDFVMFMRYLTDSQWQMQMGGDKDDFAALQSLFNHLKNVGLDNPSEPTYAAITAFRALARGGNEGMNPSQYRQAYEYVKDVWKAVTKHLKAKSASVVFIKALPYDPQEFKREYRAVWQRVFGDGVPARPQIDQQRLQETLSLIPMRGRVKRGASQSFESPAGSRAQLALPGQPAADATQGSMLNMFGQVLQMMQMMQGRGAEPMALGASGARLILILNTKY